MSTRRIKRYLGLVESRTLVEQIAKTDATWPGSFKPVKVAQELVMKVDGVYDWDRKFDSSGPITRQQAVALQASENEPEDKYQKRSLRSTLHLPKRQKSTKSGERKHAKDVFPETESQGTGKPTTDDPSEISLPSAEDEESSNIALVVLLQCLSDLVPKGKVEWAPNRHHFAAQFETTLNALTDGILRSKDEKQIFAVLEAKKMIRMHNYDAILMQETAEIVAWIRTCADRCAAFNGHRVLIAQDRHQLFIVMARYDDDYIEYLKSKDCQHRSYLELKPYGPYDVKNYLQMYDFARAVVALTMSANDALQ